MTKPNHRTAGEQGSPVSSFTPVTLRTRVNGWTPARQVAFIQALADSACVDEACRRRGMSPSSAYTLRARSEASSLRQAWDPAQEYGTVRLADAVMARALHGVAVPVFYPRVL